MPPLSPLLDLAGQEPAAGLFELLDKGPLGLSALLLVAIFWLFRYYEAKIEKMRTEHREEWNEVRKSQTDAMKEQTVAILDSNRIGQELLQRLLDD